MLNGGFMRNSRWKFTLFPEIIKIYLVTKSTFVISIICQCFSFLPNIYQQILLFNLSKWESSCKITIRKSTTILLTIFKVGQPFDCHLLRVVTLEPKAKALPLVMLINRQFRATAHLLSACLQKINISTDRVTELKTLLCCFCVYGWGIIIVG